MKRKNTLKRVTLTALALSMLVAPTILSYVDKDLIETVEAADSKQSVVFTPSANQTQSKTVTIPNLASVRSVSTNTGNVSYSVSGNNVTINVSGGTYVSRTWYDRLESKSVTDSSTSSSNSFPATKAYNSGGFTGTLNKSGGSTVASGSYTAAHSKTVSEGWYQKMRKDYHRWNSSQAKWLYYRTDPHPDTDVQTRAYNSGGYRGTLHNVRITHEITERRTYPANPWNGQEHHYVNYRDTRHFTGTVTKPASDTRVYRQNYSGTVYKGGYKDYRYAYDVVIEYDLNDKGAPEASTKQDPTAPTRDPVNIVVSARDALSRIRNIESTNGLSNNQNYGRNLLLDSDRKISNSNYNIAVYELVEPLMDNEQVTVTLKGNLASGKTNFSLYNSGGIGHMASLTPKGNGIYQATFNWKISNLPNKSLFIYTLNNSQSGTSSIEWIKMERGSKGTPYTPSDDYEARENLVNESDASINSGEHKFTFNIDPKSLRGKEVTVSAHVDLVNGTAGSRSRIGFEPAVRFTDGTTQWLGAWHTLDQGKTFNGRISNTVRVLDKPIAGWAQTGMFVQLGGTKTTISKPKMEIGRHQTPWRQSKAKANLAPDSRISTWGTAYTKTGNTYTLNGSTSGINIDTSHLKTNTDYVLTFNMKKNSGTIRNIGGHSPFFTGHGVYIDGVKKGDSYSANGANAFPNDTNPHQVKVYLRTTSSRTGDSNLYIQPNRTGYGVNFNADISEIHLEENREHQRVFQVTSNGKYDFRVTDEKGNVRTVSHTVSNIDTVAPTGSISGNPSAWTNNNVTLSMNATDDLSGVKRIKTPAGTWVNGAKATYTATANGTYSFVLEDNLGNQRTVSAAVNRIDKTLPNGTISGNPTSWTKNNATLTFNATDSGGSGVKRVRQAGGTWVNGSTTSMTVSANGTYSFEVEDNAGNVRTVSATVNRIDKTLPNGTISGNPTSWTKNNATLTFNATDSGGAGVKRVRQSGGTWVNGATTTMTVSSNGTYSFEVEDNAGNVRTVSATVNRIDKTLPNGTISGNPTAWTKNNVTLTFSGTDSGGAGVKRVRQAGGTWVNGSTTSMTVSANGTYSFEVEDNAGNVRTVSATVNRIDKVNPTMSVNTGSRGWGNSDVSVTLTHADAASGIQTKQYAWSTSTANPTTWTNYSTAVTQSSNGTWYLFGRAVDNAGNEVIQRFGPYHIDKTNPTLSASPASRGWGNSNVSVTLTHADNLSGVATKQYKWSTSTATPTAWDTYSSAVTQSTAGTWYLHARVVDNAGNVHTQRFGTYLIDKTAPSGTISGNPTAWTNKNVTLTFNGTDSGGSGVKRVRQAGGTWVNGATTTMTVTSNGTYSFEVEDNAGNTKTVSVVVNRIDKTVPEGAISGNPSVWTNKDVTLTFNATDSGGAGVKRVRKPDGTWVNGSTTSQVVSSNGTYTFRVEDNAGNIKDISASVTKIDKTLPGATTQQTPTAWTNKPVEIDVHATDSQSGIKTIEQIGGAGQNLIKNSNFATGSLADWYNNGSVVYAKVDGKDVAKFTTTTQGIYQYAAPNTDRYTISLKAKAKEASTNMRVGYLNTAQQKTFGLTTDWKEYTFTTSGNVSAGQLFHIYGTGKEFYVTDVKIEQGTSKTPYTVASQDSTQGGRPNLFKQSDSLGSYAPYHASWSKTNANTYETTLNSGYLTLQIPTLHNTVKGGGYTFSGYLYVNGKPIPTSSTKRFSTYYPTSAKVEVREDGYFVMEIPNNASGWIFHMPPAYVGAKLGDKFTVKYPKVQSGTVEEATSYKPASGDTGLNADMRTFEAPVNGTYSFRITDIAGNIRDVTHSVSNIDLVDPNGTISGNPTAWTNQNVTLTFNATDSGGSGVKRVRQAGGTWVNGSTTNMTVSINGTYSFEVEDNAGNTKTVSVVVNRIDKTVPGGTISGNPTAWTNKDVTLTFNATDSGGAGVKRVKTPAGTWVNGAQATYTVSTNGTYSFVAEDNAGNQKTVSVVVNRIDKSLPTLEITGNPANWVGTDVTLTIKASDTGGSGVKHIVLPNGSIITGSQTTYTIPSNGKFTFKVVDVAGNEQSYTIDVTKIDKTDPTGNVSPSTTNWTNQNVTLTVTTSDSQSGIKEIVKPDGTKATTATTTFIVERNGTYTFTIYDRVNNKMTKTIKVSNIDKEAPSETVIEIEK